VEKGNWLAERICPGLNCNCMKIKRKKILYGIYLTAVTFFLLEVILRIYNPFHFRLKGDKILLQANRKVVIENNSIPVLEKNIVYSTNELGFRGAAAPDSFQQYLSVISVGGSTTECQYLGEGKTWSDYLCKRLQTTFHHVWLNNAGIAGHSTFGHIVLMKDHISSIKPKVVLFLVGCNDIGRDDLTESDKSNMKGYYAGFSTFLSKNSEVCNTAVNLARAYRASKRQLTVGYINIKATINDTITLPEKFMQDQLITHKTYLQGYRGRLNMLVNICRQNNIQPVFITQPALFGNARDSITGANLATLRVNQTYNGKLWWAIQELYNDVTRKVALQNNIYLIDLAGKMPKSSLYFYDIVHFTNAGAEKAGEIIYENLNQYLSTIFPQYLKK